jgi:hypothetical protein
LQFWWDHVGERLEPEERRIADGMSFEYASTLMGQERLDKYHRLLRSTVKLILCCFAVSAAKAYTSHMEKILQGVLFISDYKRRRKERDDFWGMDAAGQYFPGEEGLPIDLDVFYKRCLSLRVRKRGLDCAY